MSPLIKAMSGPWRGDISEHNVSSLSPLDRWRAEVEQRAAARTYATEEEKQQNAATNREALLGALPVVGNLMAARDAGASAGEAVRAFGRGEGRQGLINSMLAALSGFGAITGLPTSRAAGQTAEAARDSAAVFLPAQPSKMSDLAMAMREEGEPVEKIFRATKAQRFFGPEGRLRSEVIDKGVPADTSRFAPGDVAPLTEVFPHHALYGQAPELRRFGVEFSGTPKPGQQGTARTRNADTFELSAGMPEDWNRAQLAKLLQYKVAESAGFSDAFTHNPASMMDDYRRAFRQVDPIIRAPEPGENLAAAMRWRERTLPQAQALHDAMTSRAENYVFGRMANKVAGNMEGRIVRERSSPTHPNNPPFPQTRFQAAIPIPQRYMTREEVGRFLDNWAKYGSGAE